VALAALSLALAPGAVQAAHSSETIDKIADVLAWVVMIVVPVVGIGVFLMIHVIPEKIAEKRHHPQAAAIKTLCLLSLVFGGLLWPLAWLWAFSKPVLYKMAYGTDTLDPHAAEAGEHAAAPEHAQAPGHGEAGGKGAA
jgi:CBS domain containing-hemolysin-like protein